MGDEEALALLEKFHGHLGPYVVVGYRMGEAARRILGKERLRAIVYTGLKPPISCAVDGIQLSSGCTLGKGLITVEGGGRVEAIFTSADSKRLNIKLRAEVRAHIDAQMTKENERGMAKEMMAMPEGALLEVRALD
jgi:formylmethanofuran dehydrogenase subunit E